MTKRKASTSVGSGTQEDTEHGSCTPRVLRSGTSGVTQNTLTTSEQISTERHNESSIYYDLRLDKDQDFILDLTQPLDPERRSIAQEIIETAAQFMESHLHNAPSNLGKPVDGMDVADERRPDSPVQQSSTPTDLNMYGHIGAFIEYVALMVQTKLTSLTSPSSSNVLGCCLVLPSTKSDYKPPDADDSMRIDMGLTRAKINDPIDADRGQVSHYEVLAVLEAKRKGDDNGFRDVFLQLDIHTRQLYQQQHNLRVAWGVTVSGTHVRVCHFGPDRVKSPCFMDVTMPEGRHAFVKVLINWSFCEKSQLGRDPTMEYLRDLGCWQIACPGEDRLFGPHTRCFLATNVRPM
ncbi:hypothetical protein GGI17_005167, partial [Coemansia sp. S146]